MMTMGHYRLITAGFYFMSLVVLVSSSDGERAISDAVHSVLESVQEIVSNFQQFVGDSDGGCSYRCPAGLRPVPNLHHQASSNGCGAFGIQFASSDVLDSEVSVKLITKCCDDHDICYDTCNRKKDDCDKDFKTCLESVCFKAHKMISKDMYKVCKSTVDVMYAGTVALGCKPYKDAQDKACVCERFKYDQEL